MHIKNKRKETLCEYTLRVWPHVDTDAFNLMNAFLSRSTAIITVTLKA